MNMLTTAAFVISFQYLTRRVWQVAVHTKGSHNHASTFLMWNNLQVTYQSHSPVAVAVGSIPDHVYLHNIHLPDTPC